MAMLPHERSLVQRLENKPFVLLGVSHDPERFILKRAEEEKNIPWRSWWDGPPGPIGNRWGIEYLPTFYLIDHKGVVRFSYEGRPEDPEDLDRAINKLVAEAEQDATR